MIAVYVDLEDEDNQMNGAVLATSADVRSVLDSLHHRQPFMFQLQVEDGRKLDVGVAGEVGCVQQTPSDGMPPYRMATTPANPVLGLRTTEFSVGGTATPIDGRYCIPLDTVERIVGHLLEDKPWPAEIIWEDV